MKWIGLSVLKHRQWRAAGIGDPGVTEVLSVHEPTCLTLGEQPS